MATLVSSKIIKPRYETPESLRRFKLSSFDQLCTGGYSPTAFFYADVCAKFGSRSEISKQIEDSLSKTLSYYYPFAGRLVENDHISCNDDGVELLEVDINRPMSDILQNIRSFPDEVVFPNGLSSSSFSSEQSSPAVIIQLSYFDCGGLAITMCPSHKIADAVTAATFMNDWATTCREPNYIPSPEFVANKIFPPDENPLSFPSNIPTSGGSRRYVFRPADIEKLKAMAIDSGVERPSRVDVVTALLFASVLAARAADHSGSVRPCMLFQPMNLRPLLPVRLDSIGNLVIMNMVVMDDNINSGSFTELVRQLQNEKVKLRQVYEQKFGPYPEMKDLWADVQNIASTGNYDFYSCSSLCGLPFYGIDFGWGEPVRVSLGRFPLKGALYLMDTPEKGIEAQVNLDEEQLQQIEEFLSSFYFKIN